MREHTNCGATPVDEDCAQVGTDGYDIRAKAECRAYIAQLRRHFGPEPINVQLKVKAFAHDYGSYHEVICEYESNDEYAEDWAWHVEAHLPTTWDAQALIDLGRAPAII